MKHITLTDDQVKKIVEALETHIRCIRIYNTKERNRVYKSKRTNLRHKTIKYLDQRKSDLEIIAKADAEAMEFQKIITDVQREKNV